MAYSMEFRVAVAKAYDECNSSTEVAEQFGCCASWVRRLIQRRRDTDSLAPLPPQTPDTSKLDESDLEELRVLIQKTPDMTLAELAAALTTKVSVSTVYRATEKLGLTLKKKSTHAAEQDRPDVKEKRDAWFEKVADVAVKDFVFLDEFGSTTNMARSRARGPRGERVVCKTPHGHWKTMSTVAAMSATGIVTAVVYDGAVDAEAFVGFVEQFLAPALRPGQVLVLDNLSAHQNPEVDRLVEAAGARVLRLPPYSPDFNPIEMAISKVKSLLKKMAARTVETLIDAIGQALGAVTTADAAHYMRHSGYGATVG